MTPVTIKLMLHTVTEIYIDVYMDVVHDVVHDIVHDVVHDVVHERSYLNIIHRLLSSTQTIIKNISTLRLQILEKRIA